MTNMALKIKGGLYDNIENFEKSLKESASGPITRLSDGVPLTLRFLTEPDEWLGYEEHFTEEFKYFPCTDEGCPGCEENARASVRTLAAALDVDRKRVIVVQIPKSLGEALLRRYKRTKTIRDRDYELLREGSGMDTKYDAIPASPTKRNVASYESPDLEQALIKSTSEEFRDYVGLEVEEEEKPKAKKRTVKGKPSRAGSSSPAKRRRRPDPVEDDDDDDYDEDEPPF